MHQHYPVPIDMKVQDFGQDDLDIQCPECRVTRFMTGYNLSLELPGDALVIH